MKAANDALAAVRSDGEYLRFLLRATDLLGQSLDYRETLQNVCAAAVETIADLCIVDIGAAGRTTAVAVAHRNDELTPEIRDAAKHIEGRAGGPVHPVREVLETGTIFYAPHIDDAWIERRATCPEHAEYLRRMHYTSMIVVPLVSQVFGGTGALTLVTTGERSPFTADAVSFAKGLGRLCAAAIGKARLYAEARATAATFQEAALPRIVSHSEGIKFFAHYEPAAEALLVGGDWYDVFPLPDGGIGLSVGDVAGHGLRASALMASIRDALRSTLVMQQDLSRALDVTDYVLRTERGNDHFCTALLGIIDQGARTLRLATAGHPGPKIWDPKAQNVIDPFTERDLPLGLRNLSSQRMTPKTIRLEEKTLVTFFTDGLVEWNRDFLDGERRVEDALRREDVRDADDPASALRAAVIGDEKVPDDLAILIVRLGS